MYLLSHSNQFIAWSPTQRQEYGAPCVYRAGALVNHSDYLAYHAGVLINCPVDLINHADYLTLI